VALRGQEHLDILGSGVEDGREVGGGHLRGVARGWAKMKDCLEVARGEDVVEFRGRSWRN
jgi:hypothetical protein